MNKGLNTSCFSHPLASTPDLGLTSRDASNSHGLATPDLNLPSFSILDTGEFPRSGFDVSMPVSTTRAVFDNPSVCFPDLPNDDFFSAF